LVGREAIRVVPERAELNSRAGSRRSSFVDQLRVRKCRVEVRDSGVSSFGWTGWPTHDLDAVVSDSGGRTEDFSERAVRKYGTDKSELHWHVSGKRPFT
jgi:hypothetical protein